MEIKVTPEEEAYRLKKYPDVSKIIKENETLKCTACNKPVKGTPVGHPLLEVLVCQKCHDFCETDFSTDEDGSEKYCRWCGQGGDLNICNDCACTFCEKCVERNCSEETKADVARDDWSCFVCNVKPLWKARAYCWAVIQCEKDKAKKKQLKAKSALEALKAQRATRNSGRRERYKARYQSDTNSDSDSDSERKTRRKPKLKPRQKNSTSDSESESSDNEYIDKKSYVCKRGKKAAQKKYTSSDESSDEDTKKRKTRGKTKKPSSSEESNHKETRKKNVATRKKQQESNSSEDSDSEPRKQTKKTTKNKLKQKKSESDEKEESTVSSTSRHQNHKKIKDKQNEKSSDSHEEDSDSNKKRKEKSTKSANLKVKQNSSKEKKKKEEESDKEEEEETDATSKDGESQNESTNIEWLGGLIQDFTKYAAKNHEKLSKIQEKYSKNMKNMPKDTVSDVCKIMYKEVKSSLKFLQEYKNSIKDDYSDWKRKDNRRIKRRNKKNKLKSLPHTSNLDISISCAEEEEKNSETGPVQSKAKIKVTATEVNKSSEESFKLTQNSSAFSESEQETPSKNVESDNDFAQKSKRTSSDKENTALVEQDKEPDVEKSKANKKEKIPKTSKKLEEKNIDTSEESDSEVISAKPKSVSSVLTEKAVLDKEDKSSKEKQSLPSQDSDDENKTYFSGGEESKKPDESVADSDPEATQEYVGNLEEDVETGSKASSDNATVKKSLLTLEEEASKLEEQLSNETLIHKLNKTLSSKATRKSVDIFSDDEESASEQSSTFNNTSIALTDTEQSKRKKILEAETESEISNVEEKEVNAEKNNVKENEQVEDSPIVDTPQNDRDILQETTQEFVINSDESGTKVKKVYRASVATVACDSTDSDEDLDSSEINKLATSPFTSDSEDQAKKSKHSIDEKGTEEEPRSRRETKKTTSVDEDEEAKKALLESSASDSDSSGWTKSTSKSKKSINKSKPKPSTTEKRTKIGPKSKVVGTKGETFKERMIRKTEEAEIIVSNMEEFSNDIKLNSKCFISLKQVEGKDVEIKKSRKRKSGEDSDQEIKNLADIDNLEKPRRKKNKDTEEEKPSKPKPASKKKKKDKSESEGGSSSGDDDAADQKITQNGNGLSAKSKSKTEDELAAEAILVSSNSDESDIDSDSNKKKKKKVVKSEEKDDEEVKKDKKSAKEKGSDASSDSEKKEKKKRPAWKNDKLLRGKLSESETEDEEDAFKKIQAKQKKQKEQESSGSDDEVPIRKTRRKKKTGRRQAVLSDSDVQLVDSESDEKDGKKKGGSSSSDDDFWNSQKKKSTPSDDDDSSSSSGKKKAPKRRRIKKMSGSDSDSDNPTQKSEGTPGKRKNIKKILKERDLERSTQSAAQEEKERKQRISERQRLYNEMYEHQLQEGTAVKELVLDFNSETKKTILEVHKDLVAKLKPHQAQGVKFMWDALFESVERAQKDKGSGCILAHCMGLGKTMQVVVLVHTLLAHPELELGIKTVLIVTPLSTVNNWCSEFSMWLSKVEDGDINCVNMANIRAHERAMYLKSWQRQGGVCVMSYDLYRNLSNDMSKRSKKATVQAYQRCLVDPGADLVVCDEGHLLKNEKSKLSESMSRVRTRRRVVLTGTPLQNNLLEYHCMIQFVKPSLLGKRQEFTNRFVNPIKNGQCADSTSRDVVIMKRRAHVLHKMLEGCVQRYDYSVLTPLLKPKQEYVMKIRLSKIQIEMYGHYLNFLARQGGGMNKGASLFSDYQNLQRVWTHPMVMQMRADRDGDKFLDDEAEDSAGSLKDFIDDDGDDTESSHSSSPPNTSDSDVVCDDGSGSDKGKKRKKKAKGGNVKKKYRTRGAIADGTASATEDNVDPVSRTEWWSEFVKPEDLELLSNSNKLVILFNILKECEAIGDKVLVFSQSLLSLDLIELFLQKVDVATQAGDSTEELCGLTGNWNKGQDYFRLDGQTGTDLRTNWCKIFNNPNNLRARLFLISTRAGGLGINMVGANRVVLFDASWNPSNDVQSIFRVYRFGQNKPCYIYRFLAAGTMEEKIYDRQVTKLALSGRVVDEHQIDRHFNAADLEELYSFNPLGLGDNRPTMLVPKDRLLAELLKEHSDKIEDYHEHDSLLENKPEENLTEEERQMAWNDYETEKTYQENRSAMMEQASQNQKLYMAQMAAQLKQQALAAQLPDVDVNMQYALSNLAQYYAQNNPNMQSLPGVSGLQTMSYEQQQQYQYMRQMQQMQRMAVAQQAANSPPMALPLQPVPAPTPRVNQVVDLVDLSDGEPEDATNNTAANEGGGKKSKLKLRNDLY